MDSTFTKNVMQEINRRWKMVIYVVTIDTSFVASIVCVVLCYLIYAFIFDPNFLAFLHIIRMFFTDLRGNLPYFDVFKQAALEVFPLYKAALILFCLGIVILLIRQIRKESETFSLL